MNDFLEFKRVRVKWYLTVDAGVFPRDELAYGKRAFRPLMINGVKFEFSDGLTELYLS
jgi:UDP-N-acetyl-2-amino-2-deoxyglucuronate dehydrogenase